MKNILTIILVFCAFFFAFGQKKTIDSIAIKNWVYPQDAHVSNDGKYVFYFLGKELIIQSTGNNWRKELNGGKNVSFAANNKFVIFLMPKDTLAILTLGADQIIFKPFVSSYQLSNDDNAVILACQLNNKHKELLLYNISSQIEESRISNVKDYQFNNPGNCLLFQSLKEEEYSLSTLTIKSGQIKTLWQSTYPATNITFDDSGDRFAFVAKYKNIEGEKTGLFYYREGADSAKLRVSGDIPGIESGFELEDWNPLGFSKDGSRLFFYITKKAYDVNLKNDRASVDIWNYKDEFLQSEQLISEKYNKRYLCVINEGGFKCILLQPGFKSNWVLDYKSNNNFVLESNRTNRAEINWNVKERPNVFLISKTDGTQKLISRHVYTYDIYITLSGEGKYVIWYDRLKRNYFTYNIAAGITKNISLKVSRPLFDDEDDMSHPKSNFGIVKWMDNDKSVLVYDRFDIWKLDPDGIKMPVNVTKGLGRKTNTVLRLYRDGQNTPTSFKDSKQFLLVAFNRINKDNGFYKSDLSGQKAPEYLSMGSFVYYLPEMPTRQYSLLANGLITKAKDTGVYMVSRMSAKEFPNLFITTNFKTFKPMTDLHPQDNYNWVNSTLMHWKMSYDKTNEGILYKPTDFDPKKKYPIIFYFYERNADDLNGFIRPGYDCGQMNIAAYVSRGYLVFIPDILYKIENPGPSAYNTVVSAARYLSKFPWVDTKKMGIQGHSFGAYEVNYIITHTNLLAAACSAEGLSDMVGNANAKRDEDGSSNQSYYEDSQGRMGMSLWSIPQQYVRNSPIFFAENIVTPLLIMANSEDKTVPWQQGIELFSALRRLKKKVWLLQYDTEEHQLTNEIDQKDYTIRLGQFFDRYLMDKPAPIWMTEGVPASRKRIDDGLALDTTGKQP
jgi:dienelactone hydrolase